MSSAIAPRRRVLVVCPEAPAPPTWGFALRVYHLARELSRRHDVSLLTYDTGDPTRDWNHLAQLFKVNRVPAPRTSRRGTQLRSLVSRRSFHLGGLHSAAMQRAITEVTARERFDVIQVESSQMFGYEFPDVAAVVLDEHNIEHELLKGMAETEPAVARRAYQRLEHWKARREEIDAWRRADGCVVTSTDDQRRLISEVATTPVRVVPNGVDLEYFSPRRTPIEPSSLVFVGSINYRPNTDAVLHFTKRILPLVQQSRGDVTFSVVGGGAPESVRRLNGPGVRIAGSLPDVRPIIATAAVVVVPLRMGGGTRLKVLEALAMGKAVVTTSVGCEGLDVEGGRHVLIADDAEAFAASVLRCMEDGALARGMGVEGRRLVESRYGWASVGARLESFHQALVTR